MIRKALLIFLFVLPILVRSETETVLKLCFANDELNRQLCDCVNENAPPWGARTLRIDCSYRELSSRHFDTEVLPLYTEVLDISWNRLEYVPNFSSDSAKRLIVSHNNLSAVNEKNFAKLPNLRELDLSWNAVQVVSLNAFAGLKFLGQLNLAHNNLKRLNVNVFAHLVSLETLSLSWNRQLNHSEGMTEVDVYSLYGLPTQKLKSLDLERCNLDAIDLSQGAGLERLNLRANRFERIPALPIGLKYLDFSDNPMQTISPNLRNFSKMEHLLMEDMPSLQSVDSGSFAGLPKLKSISLQNSRRLNHFDSLAFGPPDTNSSLEMMNFRGTTIRTFNSTLLPLFQRLKYLNLNGMLLTCNCDLLWMRHIQIETNGQCFKPVRLRGVKLAAVTESDYGCDRWPRWMYGIMILCLIALCAGGIWLVVMGLRPYGRAKPRNSRVGANSPYARVTIEPSRAENDYY